MRGFTLIELILILIIIGILAGVGFYSFKPKYLQNDSNYLLMKILEAKYQGINYDKRYGQESNDSIGCIDLNETIAHAFKKDHYTFKSQSEIHLNKLCFDFLGRPYEDNTLITGKRRVVTLSYYNKEANISVLPQSGYVKIEY